MAGKNKNNFFILKDKIKETADVTTLKFFPQKRGASFSFKPGQFVMLGSLPDFWGIQKAYTITSLPGEDFITVTVKRLGNFSNALCDLKKGSKVEVTGPDGNFVLENSVKDIVFLAGGIGIAPFYAMFKYLSKIKDKSRKINLFYSNKTEGDIIFLKELERLAENVPNFKVFYTLTREKKNKSSIADEFQRIDVKILKKHLGNLKGRTYFICGPTGFVMEIGEQIRKAGVKDDQIKIEFFF